MASSSGLGATGFGLPGSPIRFQPSYYVEQNIAHDSAHHDIQLSVRMPDYPGCFWIQRNNEARNTATGARRKRRKHFRGDGMFESLTSGSAINIPSVCCADEVGYQ